ncbi:BRCT-containing protein 1 [Wickerhamomyces ciferrii]|uniref:BRCT-containing protein 1 n=1 Tax=Wickerhamomyces ciferrii (strain ATCC 14091 / BCRC 22168 / CBS 111 / JCM 3599 / NBRC 0793 / NRRL Y-1031 F-60-10) TaxID=1206466 RepID=K0KF71_WICCF|nr:BRCT-containing protein 1 [Wickerhamomyces ciferrii]CCH40867.1 BRCT-containing protein 1 [Wickerhamomyces ciferrii]
MKRLFEGFKVAIIKSADLPDEEADAIATILQNHGVEYKIFGNDSPLQQLDLIEGEYSHIASNNIDFELYTFTQENMIPVVTSEFFHKTEEQNKTPPIRPYSPDPKHVLKDIHVCVGGLPVSDKEAIYGGVRALGGSFSETLNKFVTHLISIDTDEDACIAVYSLEECQIKVVLPDWIDDCLKLRKRLDETPYLLEEGESIDAKVEKLKELDIVSKDKNLIKAQKKFLNKKSFYLGEDLELTKRSRDVISSLIENSGGVINKSLTNAQCYLGKYREGEEYRSASRKGLHVGNLNWIYWMVEHQKYISPYKKLLHYPYVKHGMPQLKKFVITSTNYSGDVRIYVKSLVEALGAEFTTSLKQRNTHLITASETGSKYNAAKKWGGIAVVNHLWLEETYAAWDLKSVDNPRYSHYPRSLKMSDIAGETPLDMQVLKQFYEDGNSDFSANVIEDSEAEDSTADTILPSDVHRILTPKNPNDDNILSNKSEEDQESPLKENVETSKTPSKGSKKNSQAHESTPKPKSVNVSKISPPPVPTETPAAKSTISNNSSSTTPLSTTRPSSGRKAKDKAALKLHEDMEQLNWFQKHHKSKDIPLLPEEIEARKRKRAEELAEKEKRESRQSSKEKEDTPEKEEPVSKVKHEALPKAKKAKKTPSTPYNIIAIATGWELNFNRSDTQILSNLGITLHKEFKNNINAIIAPKFMRTEKFLTGLSYQLDYILSPTFLQEVLIKFKNDPNDVNSLPDISNFSIDVTNADSVKELTSISLTELMDRSKRRINSYDRIFHDMCFNITPKIPGGAAIVQKILKAHGANKISIVKTIKDMKNLKSLAKNPDGSYIMISNEKGFIDKFKTLIEGEEQPGRVIEWNWVINSIFHMEIDNTKNVLYSN